MKNLSIKNKEKATLLRAFQRHYYFIVRYSSMRKIINLIIAIIEFKTKREKCSSNPVYIRFEISSVCNLKCKGCSLGGIVNSAKELDKSKFTSFENFKILIKDFIPYLFKINLYDDGEPLLNKQLPDIISYLHSKKVSTCISTNYSMKLSDEYLISLVNSGLDHMIVSLDGYDQESYSRYRKGGDFQLVINNIKRTISLAKRHKASLRIETQHLIFEEITENYIEEITDLARNLGVWKHTIIENAHLNGREAEYFKGTEKERKKLGCYYLWFSGSIISNGHYYCCDFGEDMGMEMIGSASNFKKNKLHNAPQTITLRQSFSNSKALHDICKKCKYFAKTPYRYD